MSSIRGSGKGWRGGEGKRLLRGICRDELGHIIAGLKVG